MTRRTLIVRMLAGSALLCVSMTALAAGDAAPPAQKPGASADPRECLKLSGNVEIAICAERYRPKSRR